MDEETIRALEEADAQIERGEHRAWEEVGEELRAKYLKKPEGHAGSEEDRRS